MTAEDIKKELNVIKTELDSLNLKITALATSLDKEVVGLESDLSSLLEKGI